MNDIKHTIILSITWVLGRKGMNQMVIDIRFMVKRYILLQEKQIYAF